MSSVFRKIYRFVTGRCPDHGAKMRFEATGMYPDGTILGRWHCPVCERLQDLSADHDRAMARLKIAKA